MKIPESYQECDSTHLDLKSACNLQGKVEIESSDISVLWASALITNFHLSDNDLLHIARSMSRSEYSKASVKVTFLKPFCVCRIYSNGRVLIMGTLTEKQAYKRLAKTVRKIKYRTKWKVQIPPLTSYYSNVNSEENYTHSTSDPAYSIEELGEGSYITPSDKKKQNKNYGKRTGLDGNGLMWKYVDNDKIFKVSESLKTFKIDQLYCKVVLKGELDLEKIYHNLNPKYINVNLFKNYLRFQFNLSAQNEPTDDKNITSISMSSYITGKGADSNKDKTHTSVSPFSRADLYNNTFLFKDDLDISLELERVLENELVASSKTSSCLVFKSGKISILGCVNRSEIIYTFNQLIQHI